MGPILCTWLEKAQGLAESAHRGHPVLHRLLERAFSSNLENAAHAIGQIEKHHDRALAAVAWSIFWIRQGEMSQAKTELQRAVNTGERLSLWGGIAMMLLGQICLELGEPQGRAIVRDAERLLYGSP